jgi:hypothetical protein
MTPSSFLPWSKAKPPQKNGVGLGRMPANEEQLAERGFPFVEKLD